MTTVEIRGLRKSFSSIEVLRGIDLVVPDGSLTTVLGRSGSGKTTLLRILAGFERADGGSIVLDGEAVVDGSHFVAPEHRRIGYVPQEGALFPHLDVAGNVGFGLRRGAQRANRVEEMLTLVGLEGHAHHHPHELSGGQQQRVALARALAPMPRLILFDEPFSSLDQKMRGELRHDVVEVLRRTGTTAILVTHDQDEALSVSDRVAVLCEGRIGQVGPPHDLYEAPVDVEIASFVGVANFVRGTRHGEHITTPLGKLEIAGEATGVHDGDEAIALVRPEALELLMDEDADRGDASGLAAEVEHIEYFGHDALVRLRAHSPRANDLQAIVDASFGEQSLGAGTHVATLLARSSQPRELVIGKHVVVACRRAVPCFSIASRAARRIETSTR